MLVVSVYRFVFFYWEDILEIFVDKVVYFFLKILGLYLVFYFFFED